MSYGESTARFELPWSTHEGRLVLDEHRLIDPDTDEVVFAPVTRRERAENEAYLHGSNARKMSISADRFLFALQQKISKKEISEEEVQGYIEEISDAIEEKLRTFEYGEQDGNWNDYFRLRARREFLPEKLFAASLFTTHTSMKIIQKKLIDGAAGTSVESMKLALKLKSVEGISEEEKGQLVGVANEEMVMASVNYQGGRLAVPAHTFHDLFDRTDVSIYHRVGRKNYIASLQVKTSRPPKDEPPHVPPERGFIIYASDFGNQGLRGSELFEKLFEPQELTPGEMAELHEIITAVNTQIDAGLKEHPGLQIGLIPTSKRKVLRELFRKAVS